LTYLTDVNSITFHQLADTLFSW